MKTKNNLIALLALSLLVNVILIAGNKIKMSGNTLNASVSSSFEFAAPEPAPLEDYKKAIYPCYLSVGVYLPYSTFEQKGGFITKTELDAALKEDAKANGISYYYAQDNTQHGGRLFIVFKADQKTTENGRTIIKNLPTLYHDSDMLCPVDCPQ